MEENVKWNENEIKLNVEVCEVNFPPPPPPPPNDSGVGVVHQTSRLPQTKVLNFEDPCALRTHLKSLAVENCQEQPKYATALVKL